MAAPVASPLVSSPARPPTEARAAGGSTVTAPNCRTASLVSFRRQGPGRFSVFVMQASRASDQARAIGRTSTVPESSNLDRSQPFGPRRESSLKRSFLRCSPPDRASAEAGSRGSGCRPRFKPEPAASVKRPAPAPMGTERDVQNLETLMPNGRLRCTGKAAASRAPWRSAGNIRPLTSPRSPLRPSFRLTFEASAPGLSSTASSYGSSTPRKLRSPVGMQGRGPR